MTLARVRGVGVTAGIGLLLAVGAGAQIPSSSDDKCATSAVSQPRPPSSRPPLVPGILDEPTERPGRSGGPVPLVTPGAGLPVGQTPPLPPTPTTTQATPPSSPPPAVPGLPPAASGSEKDKKDAGERPKIAAIQAQGEVPEERLLDVGVQIFRPGNERAEASRMAKLGLSPDVRRSEGRYMAFHLRKTLESTGNWGAVRVVPGPGEGLDVLVEAAILESNGKRLALDVEAHDSLGRRWLHRVYRGEADFYAYHADGGTRLEAFQEIYNRIANDLLRARDERGAEELVEVRRVSMLRFASQLAPSAFASYLKTDKDRERFELIRYPAQDDPMLRRIAAIRERDLMFVDTLNDYYLGFYDRMSGPYADWRRYSYDEQSALDKINRESRLKKLLGGAAILAGILMPRDSRAADAAGDVAVLAGSVALQAGFQQAQQKVIHETALKELATSFEADSTPLLVEVEGQQRELSGSAEAQFVAWRELLRQIFSVETGAPDDPNRTVAAGPPPRR